MKKATVINEIIWYLVAIVFAFAVCFPVLYQANYAYLPYNLIIVVVAFTYLRYILSFKSLRFLQAKWIRVFWFVLNLLLFLFILNRMEFMVRWYDSFAFFEMFQNKAMSITEQKELADYVYKEYVIFSIASFVGIIGFNLRILGSFWKSSRVKSEKVIK